MRGSLFFSACLLSLAGACSAADAPHGAGPGGAGGGGNGGSASGPRTLEFDEIAELSAREQVVLRVRAEPARAYRVRFSLPSSGGDPLDAVLDRSESDTDESGVAEVRLTAPSASTEFDVRASVEGAPPTALHVSVKDTGFTSVLVRPTYSGAYRIIETWTATVHPNKSCAELPGVPPDDGPLSAIAASDAAPIVTDVPALTPLAVTLRSGHYVGGCASVEMLPAGGTQVVQVTVLNRPIELSKSRLALSLGLASVEPAWLDFLTDAERAALTAVTGTSSGDVDTLLDAMRGAAGESQQALENARKTEGWDALLAAHWGAGADSKLTATLTSWLSAGRARFVPGAHVIEGALDSPGPSDGELELLTVAGIPAEQAGFISPARITWSAGSDDQVFIVSDLYVIGSRLATALAEAAVLEASADVSDDGDDAGEDVDALEDAASALAIALDCSGVAGALTAAGADDASAFASCDGACLEALCVDAIAALWQRARDATALAPARLMVSASGAAYVGDEAQVAGINGSWLGSLVQGEAEGASTGGSLKAATPRDD